MSDFIIDLDCENRVVGVTCNYPENYVESESETIQLTSWVADQAIDGYKEALKYPTLRFFASSDDGLYVFAMDETGCDITIESERDFEEKNSYLRDGGKLARILYDGCEEFRKISARCKGVECSPPKLTFEELRERCLARPAPYVRSSRNLPRDYQEIELNEFLDRLSNSGLKVSLPIYPTVGGWQIPNGGVGMVE